MTRMHLPRIRGELELMNVHVQLFVCQPQRMHGISRLRCPKNRKGSQALCSREMQPSQRAQIGKLLLLLLLFESARKTRLGLGYSRYLTGVTLLAGRSPNDATFRWEGST